MEIIGVDHVQFAVRDVDAGARLLWRHGYALHFEEPDFNAQARSYFRGLKKSMAYLKRGGSRVELITGAEQEGEVRYIPVFGGRESTGRRPAFDIGDFRAFWHEDLSSVCASRTGEAPALDSVILRASRPEHSLAFWRGLGFAPISEDGDWYKLAFPRNLISMPLTILLARHACADGQGAQVDDLGCSSIALITRDLRADRSALDGARHTVSEVTALRINGKPLSLCFATGPSGELVELVEFGRA